MEVPLSVVKQLYDLELSFVSKIQGGYLSENYELTDGSARYFLKKHRHTDVSSVKSVGEVERFFAEGGVPVILPLQTGDGSNFFEASGGWYSLYPFVSGHNIERGVLSPAAAASLGGMLGIIHRRGKESSLQAPDTFRPWNKTKLLAKIAAIESEIAKEHPLSEFGALSLENMRLKKSWFAEHEVPFDSFGASGKCLLHGDYFSDNVFFDELDHISYVYDFEKALYAPPLYEVFRSMFVSFFSIPTEENLQRAKLYLEVYLAENPLSPREVRDGLTIAYLKQMNSVWVEEEHYIRRSKRTDPIFPSQCASVRYLIEQQEHIERTLLN